VTNKTGIPHAVLVRAVEPLEGIEDMLKRAGKSKLTTNIGDGPGKVASLLGIHYSHTGHDLAALPGIDSTDRIWLEDRGIVIESDSIETGPRIGVEYAGRDAGLPYRFRVNNRLL
jgi:DNA-3-methyladenine glycosylase